MTELYIEQVKRKKMAWLLALLAAVMFGFGFSLTPLYDLFCDITGLNGKGYSLDSELLPPTKQSDAVSNRKLDVVLITQYGNNVGTKVEFEALQHMQTVSFNEPKLAKFRITNRTDQPMVVRAIPSIVPQSASKAVNKIECFCMREQALKPRQSREVTMNYWYEPTVDESITSVVMGYTIFDITADASDESLAQASLIQQ